MCQYALQCTYVYVILYCFDSSSEASYTSDDECNGNIADSQISGSKDSESATVTFESLFPTMRQVYGTEPETPKKADILLYKK